MNGPHLATASKQCVQQTERVLREVAWVLKFSKTGVVSVFCLHMRGDLGGCVRGRELRKLSDGGERQHKDKPVAGCHITKAERKKWRNQEQTKERSESYYYVICPLQTDRRHWSFIFLNLRFHRKPLLPPGQSHTSTGWSDCQKSVIRLWIRG